MRGPCEDGLGKGPMKGPLAKLVHARHMPAYLQSRIMGGAVKEAATPRAATHAPAQAAAVQ